MLRLDRTTLPNIHFPNMDLGKNSPTQWLLVCHETPRASPVSYPRIFLTLGEALFSGAQHSTEFGIMGTRSEFGQNLPSSSLKT